MDMSFFVPGAADEVEAELVYGRLLDDLSARFGPLSPDRFEGLFFKQDGVHRTARVGLTNPWGGEAVVAIFRVVADGRFLLVTPTRGGFLGDPIEVSASSLPIRFFSPEVVNPASALVAEDEAPARRKHARKGDATPKARRPAKRQPSRSEPRKRPPARTKARADGR